MSQRLTLEPSAETGPRAANAIDDERILDAAYELLLAVGMGRVTMADIARHAGVSRATLYRRWPNLRAMIAALVTREWRKLAADAVGPTDVSHTTGRARGVAAVVAVARATRAHPLLRKIIEVDPEFLLTYLLRRTGTSTREQLSLIERGLRDGVADGSIRPGDNALRARAIMLTAMSFVLTGPVVADDLDALDRELAEMLDGYLAP